LTKATDGAIRRTPVITELRERISHLEGGMTRRKQTVPFGVSQISMTIYRVVDCPSGQSTSLLVAGQVP